MMNTKKRSINLVPLINIIFLLLIFFLVSGTLDYDVDDLVDIPYSTSKNAFKVEDEDLLAVNINSVGEIFIDGKLCDFVSLKKHIIGNKVIIKSDKNLPVKKLFNTIKALDGLGDIYIKVLFNSSYTEPNF